MVTANNTIQKTRELQRTLYRAAKQSRERRFHALYDRMYRPDILCRAWVEVKANGGSAGIDGISIRDIERSGVEHFLAEIAEDLIHKRYRPKPVRRVMIPKADGRQRPLGIPCVRDRIVQQACKIVIEPIFEANFEDCSYGFRPKRSAQQAVQDVKATLVSEMFVIDADIEGFFDNIDHEMLLNLVQRRISDRRVVKLIRQWLKAGVITEGVYHSTKKGTPQGGVISPLLANIYLHVLDRYWKLHCNHLGKLVRYCDDFVVICRNRKGVKEAMHHIKAILEKLRLRLHPVKTRIVNTFDDGFDFLGFYIRKCRSRRTGKLLPFMWPSTKSMKRIRGSLKELTSPKWACRGHHEVIFRLNQVIRGWRNYFAVGNGTQKFQALDGHLRWRLWRLFQRKMGSRGRKKRERFRKWYKECGVVRFYQAGIFGRNL